MPLNATQHHDLSVWWDWEGEELTFVHCGSWIGGGHLYFRLDIILIKRLSKHTLNTCFSGMKIDPKYAFLHAFFLICPSCPFQNLSILPKVHPFFFKFCTFLHPLNNVRAYIAWSWKTTLITWFFFLLGWYPTSNTSAPPPRSWMPNKGLDKTLLATTPP